MASIREVQEQLEEYLSHVRGTADHILCPMCDGQGEVVNALINRTGESILICDECDSVWLNSSPVTEEHVKGFHDIMKERGLPPLWTELTIGTSI